MEKTIMTLTCGRVYSRSTKRTSSFGARLIATFAAVLCCATTIVAEPVSPQAARQAAAKFMNKKGVSLKSEAMRAKSRDMGISTDSGEQTEASPYYVFNAKASKGFVVVSGDDCVGDNLVLGYSAQGSFDAADIPDNLQWWLDVTATQISTLSRLGVKARKVALHDNIAPMLTTRWDQSLPYNAFCPVTDGQLCLTGCMATALSQVMYYHHWPQGPIGGELPAYTMANGRVIDGLPVTTFDWDNMIDEYGYYDSTNSYIRLHTTETQDKAVATLMRYCGQLIQMNYTPQLSTGYLYDIDLLTNVFGYDPGVYCASVEEYTLNGWDELLYNELREGRPLVYSGQSTGGGHAFVVDGYEVQDGEGYYNVNWGWAGVCNGFFKITLLNPDQSGSGGSTTKDGYSYHQTALIGLCPRNGSSEGNYRYLNSLGRSGVDENGDHIFMITNPSYRPGVFSIALAERNADGTPDDSRLCGETDIEMKGYTGGGFISHFDGLNQLIVTDNMFDGLTPGQHELVFVNRERLRVGDDTSEMSGTNAPWRPLFGSNCYIKVNIDDEGKVTERYFYPQHSKLTVSDANIKIDGLKQRGINQSVTVTVQNTSTDGYVGGAECFIYYVKDGELKANTGYSWTGLMVEAGDTQDIYFNFSVPIAGEYVVLLTTAGDGKDITGSKLTDIAQAPGYMGHKSVTFDDLAFKCLAAEYKERNDDEGYPAYYLDLAVGNGTPLDYDAAVLAKLYRPNAEGGYDPIEFPNTPYILVQINSYAWKAFSIRLPEALEPGVYGLELLIANDFHSLIGKDYFVFASGPLTVSNTTGIENHNDETTTNNCYYDLNGRRLSGKPTSKGLYINKGKKIMISR